MLATLAPPPHLEHDPATGLKLLTFLVWSTRKQKKAIEMTSISKNFQE
jgi:hypothetical protein